MRELRGSPCSAAGAACGSSDDRTALELPGNVIASQCSPARTSCRDGTETAGSRGRPRCAGCCRSPAHRRANVSWSVQAIRSYGSQACGRRLLNAARQITRGTECVIVDSPALRLLPCVEELPRAVARAWLRGAGMPCIQTAKSVTKAASDPEQARNAQPQASCPSSAGSDVVSGCFHGGWKATFTIAMPS